MPQATFTLSAEAVAKLGGQTVGPELNAAASAYIHKSLGVAAPARGDMVQKRAEYDMLSGMYAKSGNKLHGSLRKRLADLSASLKLQNPVK